MLNRLTGPFADDGLAGSGGWQTDQRPVLRLGLLACGLLVPLLVVGLRLGHLQGGVGAAIYEDELSRTTQRVEPIPSRDGRILSADGAVLAQDIEQFAVTVHYRWLEEPPDPSWLKQQVLSRLDRKARRQPERVAAEIEQLLEQRTALWDRLAAVSRIDPEVLLESRRKVQQRVERMYARILEQRQARTEAAVEEVSTDFTGAWWQRGWEQIKTALVTPPERVAEEPLLIQEQLDYHLVLSELPLAVAAEIEAHPELYPGVQVTLTSRRVYPEGTLAPHVVGFRTLVDGKVLQERRARFPQGDPLDYREGDRTGISGLERYYERHLRGLRGERRLTFNRRGEIIRNEIVRQPRTGRDLVLTLNVPLQRAADRLLDEALHKPAYAPAPDGSESSMKPLPQPQGGAIVAIDVRTGAVLAAASAPTFDINLMSGEDEAGWKRTVADPRKPMFSRTTQMTLPPGSVFKVVSAIAFLQHGQIQPEQAFYCQGYLDQPDQHRCYTYRNFGVGHGDVQLVDALARSCNVYFFAAARRTGSGPISDWARRFGFGQATGVDLPGEQGGNLPMPKSSMSRRGAASGDTLGLSIGQAQLTVTPLQVARLMAALANGGQLVTPHFVETAGPVMLSEPSAEDGIADTIAIADPVSIPELSPRVLAWVQLGMQQVVAHPQGTGYKTVRLKEVAIAGKTGTAEIGGGKPDHAWFAGYVPADRPRVAFVVVLEQGGSGGHAAGPVARKLVEAMLAEGVIEPVRVTERGR